MRLAVLALAAVPLGAAAAQTINAPHLMPNDTWTFRITNEKGQGHWRQTRAENTVVRVGSDTIALRIHTVGSDAPPVERLVGKDWSRFRTIDGHETVVNRPLAFPLTVGKTWKVAWSADHPSRHTSYERQEYTYRAVGWEDVTVPAGKCHALKVEADGRWEATITPALTAGAGSRIDAEGATTLVQTHRVTPITGGGRGYKAYWYVPEVKWWVKALEETYGPDGTRISEGEMELESYRVGK